MDIIAQPHDQVRLGDFLLQGLESTAVSFSGASAFARRSGVSYLAPAIYEFSKKKRFQLSVGIDLQGTSREALELLLQSAGAKAQLFIFHNPKSAFHPKTFRFEYSDRWEVYSGSGNLTRGGLFENYEAGLSIGLQKTDKLDKQLNKRLQSEFDRWSDVSSGLVRVLDQSLIKALVDRKLLPSEATIVAARAAASQTVGSPKKTSLFQAAAVPPAPPVPKVIAGITKPQSGTGKVKSGKAKPQTKASTATAVPKTFVMTVRQTDVGVGQTTPGAQKRAAEIFIPLRSVFEQPTFWGWPALFVPDPTWTGAIKHGYGKMDRRQMPFYLGSQAEWVTMTYNPDKGDFRLRNSALRDAGQVDDILRVSVGGTAKTPVYVAEFISPSDPQYPAELARCTVPLKPPSTKLYGYY